jgi:hypothetical protein
MTATRFVIEGEWLGYRSSMDRVVHRTVHSVAFKRLREWCEKNPYIHYTDGTRLRLTVRDCKPREHVEQIHGYDELIRCCVAENKTRVEDLS